MTATLLERLRPPQILRGGRRPAARGRRALLPGACLLFYAGQGLAAPAALLYLAGPVHLPVGSVGGCMTAAGFLGLLAAVPAGWACDRGRPQTVLAVALAALAAAACGFVFVRTVPEALGVACLYGCACQVAYTARAALAAVVEPDDPAGANARLYRIGNVGYALATPAMGLAATWGTASAYRLALLGAGGAFAVAALLAALVPARRRVAGAAHPAASGARSGRPWRDPRYLAVTGLYAVTAVQFCIAEFALPLWVVDHTRAPRAMVGASALISTLVVTTLQPAASRRASATRSAARAMAVAGIVAGVGCLALAAASGRGPAPAAVLVAVGALTLAVAELCQAVGSITLSYRLAPPEATGTYQGFFSLGQGLTMAAGPAVLARSVLRPGAGWPAAAVLLAISGLLVPLVVRPRRGRAARSVSTPPGGNG
jgi:MFS family permease